VLQGKAMVAEVGGLRYNLGLPNAMPALAGKLRLSTYRLVLKALSGGRGARHRLPESFEELHVPWGCLARVDETSAGGHSQLLFVCKDLRVITVTFNQKQPALLSNLAKKIGTLAFTGGIQLSGTFAYHFKFAYSPALVPNGWSLYDCNSEFERQGCLTPGSPQSLWFAIDNSGYKLSPTYPSRFLVPLCLTKAEFKDAAKFRSKRRLPALTWQSPSSKACLVRSAQPMVGVTGARSSADERLLDLYRVHGDKSLLADPRANELRELYLVDCRAQIAATGNSLKGAGAENAKNYTNATLKYCNIGNIHTMRNSLHALVELTAPSGLSGKEQRAAELHFLSNLEQSKWLEHVQLCLEASVMTAEKLHLEGASVLVHCSDGWDRTAQVCGTAQVLLDPFFRTIRGLAVLVEKDWCAFGHKFGQRCGHGQGPSVKANERSPIFLQWLDVLHQVRREASQDSQSPVASLCHTPPDPCPRAFVPSPTSRAP